LVRLYEDGGQGDELFEFSKAFHSSSVHFHTSPFLVSWWRGLAMCKKSWMNPHVEIDDLMNNWTLVTFLRVSQSQTPASLTGSISTLPSTDEAEILYCGLCEHALLSLEVEPMFAEDVITHTTMEWCSSFVWQPNMRMSSM